MSDHEMIASPSLRTNKFCASILYVKYHIGFNANIEFYIRKYLPNKTFQATKSNITFNQHYIHDKICILIFEPTHE